MLQQSSISIALHHVAVSCFLKILHKEQLHFWKLFKIKQFFISNVDRSKLCLTISTSKHRIAVPFKLKGW
jgi:hypothetical protein